MPSFSLPPYFYKVLSALIISFIIIFPILGVGSTASIAALLILTVIVYIIINNMTLESKSDALPFTSYPVPPHTGLDGISLESLIAGTPLSAIQN